MAGRLPTVVAGAVSSSSAFAAAVLAIVFASRRTAFGIHIHALGGAFSDGALRRKVAAFESGMIGRVANSAVPPPAICPLDAGGHLNY